VLIRIAIFVCLGAFLGAGQLARAQVYASDLPLNHPSIDYQGSTILDSDSRLPREARLAGLLERLGINVDTQVLVFSKTSVQAPRISPRNPRAIYFNDQFAVGYVPGGKGIEVAAVDPRRGVVFYTFDTRDGKPSFTRGENCVHCHQGPATAGVPGIFVGSVFPNVDGTPSRRAAIVTDHKTPFADRWGGWYVNATRGQQRDRANSVASNPADPEDLDSEGKQNLTSLSGRFTIANYLLPASDIVALMTFEHQTQMVNLITRLSWQSRIAPQVSHRDDVGALVAYMLFAEEAPLPEPLVGVSSFTRTFPERGPRDQKGRSLRDFDLRTRLFRYPLSYLIYSPAFDAIPDAAREQVYRRLFEVLSGRDQSADFSHLSADDRNNILEILRATKPNLPAYWNHADLHR
jgi:hypothetical protein